MARITVEDCLNNEKNRFKLVLIAAKRARMLAKNPGLAYVDWDRDKAPVVALREIAAKKVTASILDDDNEDIESASEIQEKQDTSGE
jgi:DNA-directed RNA polymerase subunit omega